MSADIQLTTALSLLREGARNMGNEERAFWKQRVMDFLKIGNPEQRRDCPRYKDCERGIAECYCKEIYP